MSTFLQSPATATGRFGPYGGRYVPETLMVPLFELERAYREAKADASFQARLQDLLENFAGRPTPLQLASRLTEKLGGPRIYLKREDLPQMRGDCSRSDAVLPRSGLRNDARLAHLHRTKSTTPSGRDCLR